MEHEIFLYPLFIWIQGRKEFKKHISFVKQKKARNLYIGITITRFYQFPYPFAAAYERYKKIVEIRKILQREENQKIQIVFLVVEDNWSVCGGHKKRIYI